MSGGYLKRELKAGDAIRYWQLGAIAEERFDVPDAPMKGEMDPFFFLTKHKNFIPHEYPCRTTFAERYRDKRPDVRGAFAEKRWWLPFGSPRVDLSGFWFRPTRLATWARTYIEADATGVARLNLGTCGGAVLWLNGSEVGWMAPYSRNLEARQEFELPLVAGLNEITLFFDDLSERDARYFFQLDYLAGPTARVAVPVPVDAAAADAFEAALDRMYFDRQHYFEGDITLMLPRACRFLTESGFANQRCSDSNYVPVLEAGTYDAGLFGRPP